MNESPHPDRPLVDPAILARLRDELQPGPGICEVFINDYIALLPRRLNRLHQAVECMDLKAAMDAVLSLKTSSLMVGASCLGSLAAELESELRSAGPGPGTAPPASAFLTTLETIGARAAGTIAGLKAHAGCDRETATAAAVD